MPFQLFVTIIGSIVAFLLLVIIVYSKLYKKAPPDSALVVAGGQKKKVILGGTLINPLTQTTQLVSLNTMQLNVERKGQ